MRPFFGDPEFPIFAPLLIQKKIAKGEVEWADWYVFTLWKIQNGTKRRQRALNSLRICKFDRLVRFGEKFVHRGRRQRAEKNYHSSYSVPKSFKESPFILVAKVADGVL